MNTKKTKGVKWSENPDLEIICLNCVKAYRLGEFKSCPACTLEEGSKE